MIVRVYLVLEPGMDRPCLSHSYPHEYKKKPGAKIYSLDISIHDFDKVDGKLIAIAQEEHNAPRTTEAT